MKQGSGGTFTGVAKKQMRDDREYSGEGIGQTIVKFREGHLRPTELLNDCLKRIESLNEELNAVVEIKVEEAFRAAEKADKKWKSGKTERKSLLGIPLLVKDTINIKGFRTTCCSEILKNYISPYDATCVERLKGAGAIILGKTNCDEFGMGSSNEFSYYGPVKNPVNWDYVAGGSSGGSAASVAAGFVPAALGTDTGGSIRLPASFCGVTGVKPTYGRVSRYGLTAYASSLDQIGPLAGNVEDCARILNVIAGPDVRDSTSYRGSMPDLLEKSGTGESKVIIGRPIEFFQNETDDEVKKSIEKALDMAGENNFALKEMRFPMLKYALAAYYIIASAEASSNLSRFDGIRYGLRAENFKDSENLYKESRTKGFGKEVKRRIMLGTFALSAGYYEAYYLKALKVRELIFKSFMELLRKCDVIAAPVSPGPAFRFGEKTDDPVRMYLSDAFTSPVNLAGLPAVSLPGPRTAKGLPIGIQLIGRPFEEDKLLRIAGRFERSIEE